MRVAVIYTFEDEIEKKYCSDYLGRIANDDKKSVIKALKAMGHDVVVYPVDIDLFENLKKNKTNIDIIFNLADDGFYSEPTLEPYVVAMLEVLKIPYTGSGFLSLSLCLDKGTAKSIFSANGVPTPNYQLFEKDDMKIAPNLNYPIIIKPVHEDASIGIRDESVVHNDKDLYQRAKYVLDYYKQPALLEEYIQGREFNVGFLGSTVLPVSEIVFDLPEEKPNIVNYSAKWVPDSKDYKGTVRKCPADIPQELEDKLITIAKKASRVMLCKGYYRVDFRVDKDNNPYVLEVNPNPDISEDAGLAAMAKVAGINYTDMIGIILGADPK